MLRETKELAQRLIIVLTAFVVFWLLAAATEFKGKLPQEVCDVEIRSGQSHMYGFRVGTDLLTPALNAALSGDLSHVEAQVDLMSGMIRLVTSHMRQPLGYMSRHRRSEIECRQT